MAENVRDAIACPECGAKMVLRRTQKYKWANGEGRLFFGCSRYPDCRGTHGAHPDGSPLGTPADAETKAARIAAHTALDKIVQARGWGRDAKDNKARHGLYIWLGRKLGIPEDKIATECHVGKFDSATCRRVENICAEALERDTCPR
ncbi:MAG TPA: zinc-finger-containing protein [Phycisphaerae bacterium]|nr:zinc-finger-containing protein [Phycisphaerae bacterium]